MDPNDIGVIALLQRRMGWLGRNHDVLAQNIANADTPGYKARELAPQGFKAELAGARPQLVMATTAPAHMAPGGAARPSRAREQRDPYEVTVTGNAVTLEEQAVRIARNAMDYQLATALYDKAVGMLRAAAGQRR